MTKRPKKVGRPRTIKNVMELQLEDGLVKCETVAVRTSVFERETSLCAFIVENIDAFVQHVFDDSVLSFKTNFPIEPQRFQQAAPGFRVNVRRVDLYVVGAKGTYVIELKNPRHLAENRDAIGQLLDYGREIVCDNKQLVLITTKFDLDTAKTIQHYHLPIRYIFMNKQRTLEFVSLAKITS